MIKGDRMQKKIISVIVPVYNVEKFLPRCIESIINQTYGNIEIIIINDGSTDDCPKICDEYRSKEPRIVVIHQSNSGLSSARNSGINIAKGEFLCFIDSDDYMDEMMLEKLYDSIHSNKADIAICNYNNVDENGEILEVVRTIEKESLITGEKACEIMNLNYSVAWAKMYRTRLFTDIRYPTGKLHEDEYVAHRLLIKADNIALSPEPLYNYTQRATSIMNQKINIKRLDGTQAFMERIEFYNNTKRYKNITKTFIALMDSYIRYYKELCKEDQELMLHIHEEIKHLDKLVNIHLEKRIKIEAKLFCTNPIFYRCIYNIKIFKRHLVQWL